MAVARWLETDTNSNKDISAAVSIGAYTADADRMVVVDVSLDQVAGNGDYVIYVTRQINGAGSAYVMLPKTTCAAASGETAIAMQSGPITVRSGDVLTVMVDGLAGDTSTPDTVVRWFEMATLRPATADRQLTVAATGEGSANVTELKDVELTESGAGYLAAAFVKLLDVAVPVLTAASVNQTGDAYARLGAPAGASVSADIAALPTDADVQTAAAAALTAYDPPTKAELDSAVAPLATAAALATVDGIVDDILVDTGTTLDALIKDIPTTAEFEARTLAAADYTVVSDLPTVPTAADIKTALEADGSKLDHLWEMTEDDGGVRRLTENALEQAPSGGGSLTVEDIVDGVLDELLSEHTDVGSVGAGIAAAGSAGDPWSTPLPGAYGTGTAGQIVGDTLGGATGSVIYAEGATLDDLLEELADAHGDGSWEGSSAGSGTGSYTDTVTDADSNPLDGVRVQLSTDSAGADVAYEAYTNALGVFSMRPDPGTYYVWFDLAGYTFTQGAEVTVS